MKHKVQVDWQDEDTVDDQLQGESDDFAQMLKETAALPRGKSLRVGNRISAVVSMISHESDDILLSFASSKESGIISKKEFLDDKGQLKIACGDTIEAFIVSKHGGEIILSHSMGTHHAQQNALETAYNSGLPVKGKITGVNKGGFTVAVLGKSGFCPVSQLEKGFINDPSIYIGKEYDFIITQSSGRNIVLSRSSLIRAQEKKRVEELKKIAKDQQIITATVRELKPFGAMVDLDGVIGMIHISEISYARLDTPDEKLRIGEKLPVKILSVDDSSDFPRISVSSKAVEGDPWERVTESFKVGENYPGKVKRLTKFGAFVELEPGVEGLVHISEMSWVKKIHKPEDFLKLGDLLSMRLLEMNPAEHRISLSMKSVEADPWRNIEKRFLVGEVYTAPVEELKPFGATVLLAEGIAGFIPLSTLKKVFGAAYRKKASPPESLEVKILEVRIPERKVLLSLAQVEADEEAASNFAEYLKERTAGQTSTGGALGSLGEMLQSKFNSKAPR